MTLHSTRMKRIVAKEFLLFVGCMVVLLLIAVFGWTRNSWLEHRSASIGVKVEEHAKGLDSLRQRAVPRHLDFLDLFEPTFVRRNYEVFLVSPFWTMDPFLTGAPGGPILRKVEGDPFASSGTKPPFDPNKPYTVVADDPFAEFGGEQVLSPPPPKISRRYLICFVKALDKEEYLTSNQLNRLAEKCGRPADTIDKLNGELNSYMVQPENRPMADRILAALRKAHEAGATEDARKLAAAYKTLQSEPWRPPADAAEVYNPSATGAQITTWEAALLKRGVPKVEMNELLHRARSDSSRYLSHLVAMRALLCDTIPYAELLGGYDHLNNRRVLRCNFDELLYTLQNKPVPPSQEAIEVFTKQRGVVDELRQKQNYARASLWNEAKQWTVVKWAAIVLFVLVYPLRLLVLGTRWALRTLRS